MHCVGIIIKAYMTDKPEWIEKVYLIAAAGKK